MVTVIHFWLNKIMVSWRWHFLLEAAHESGSEHQLVQNVPARVCYGTHSPNILQWCFSTYTGFQFASWLHLSCSVKPCMSWDPKNSSQLHKHTCAHHWKLWSASHRLLRCSWWECRAGHCVVLVRLWSAPPAMSLVCSITVAFKIRLFTFIWSFLDHSIIGAFRISLALFARFQLWSGALL